MLHLHIIQQRHPVKMFKAWKPEPKLSKSVVPPEKSSKVNKSLFLFHHNNNNKTSTTTKQQQHRHRLLKRNFHARLNGVLRRAVRPPHPAGRARLRRLRPQPRLRRLHAHAHAATAAHQRGHRRDLAEAADERWRRRGFPADSLALAARRRMMFLWILLILRGPWSHLDILRHTGGHRKKRWQ